jgi:Carboxypeptidase regulatory-like domain
MRRMAKLRAGLTVAFGLTFCLALGATPALAATGSIGGTVTDAVSEEGIDGIWVCASQAFPGSGSGCDFTDEDGNYTISGLQPSVYKVVFAEESSLNYLAQWYNGKATREEAVGVAVGDGADVTGIDAALETGGQITGTVTDVEDGEPIEGIEICARQVDRIFELSVIQCDRSDTDGEYTVKSLPTGQFKLELGPAIFSREAPNYIRQYYPGKSSWSEAGLLAVTAGSTYPGFDAALQPGIGITGTVSEVGGGPVGLGPRICAHDAVSEAIVQCTGLEMDGTYWIPGLPFGSYRVSFAIDVEEEPGLILRPDGFVRQYYKGKPTFGEADMLSSAGPATFTGIDAQLVRGPETFPNRRSPLQPVVVTLIQRPRAPILDCRKGFHRRFVKGKRRCVKVHKRHRRHGHGHGPRAHATDR